MGLGCSLPPLRVACSLSVLPAWLSLCSPPFLLLRRPGYFCRRKHTLLLFLQKRSPDWVPLKPFLSLGYLLLPLVISLRISWVVALRYLVHKTRRFLGDTAVPELVS